PEVVVLVGVLVPLGPPNVAVGVAVATAVTTAVPVPGAAGVPVPLPTATPPPRPPDGSRVMLVHSSIATCSPFTAECATRYRLCEPGGKSPGGNGRRKPGVGGG